MGIGWQDTQVFRREVQAKSGGLEEAESWRGAGVKAIFICLDLSMGGCRGYSDYLYILFFT